MRSVVRVFRAALIGAAVVAATVSTDARGACRRVGTWSLENFELDAKRGFPERTDAIPPRTAEDVRRIAEAIKGPIDAKILLLQQINGVDRDNRATSAELDGLLRDLGPSYRYFLGSTGGHQRLAFVWDSRLVAANSFLEIAIPETRVADRLTPDGGPSYRDTFARDPLVGRFTFLKDGEPMNDFVFVGLDLAFGQWRVENHDAAMRQLVQALEGLEGKHPVYPRGEADILIGGDLNASPYDGNRERLFSRLDDGRWQLLARNVYPPTRVNGSRIDYFFATRHTAAFPGLVGEEIEDDEAVVHLGLAADGRRAYRSVYSDHFPVTTCIDVRADND